MRNMRSRAQSSVQSKSKWLFLLRFFAGAVSTSVPFPASGERQRFVETNLGRRAGNIFTSALPTYLDFYGQELKLLEAVQTLKSPLTSKVFIYLNNL
jgi:hypothetical protein